MLSAALIIPAVAAVTALIVVLARRRRRRPAPAVEASGYPDAPSELGQAKGAFERANARLLAAHEEWRAAAAEVATTGERMTAIYQAWATARAATALEQNGGARASVFDRLEHADQLLSRPAPGEASP